jgi:hypothetical protein
LAKTNTNRRQIASHGRVSGGEEGGIVREQASTATWTLSGHGTGTYGWGADEPVAETRKRIEAEMAMAYRLARLIL